jgi:hypothetical protein
MPVPANVANTNLHLASLCEQVWASAFIVIAASATTAKIRILISPPAPNPETLKTAILG